MLTKFQTSDIDAFAQRIRTCLWARYGDIKWKPGDVLRRFWEWELGNWVFCAYFDCHYGITNGKWADKTPLLWRYLTVWRPQPYPSPIRHICPQQTAPQPSNLDVVSRLRSFTFWICRWQLGTSSERRCQTRRIIERGAERDLGEKWEWRGCWGLGGCRLTIGWCMRDLHICTCEWLIGFQMMVLRTQSPDALPAYELKANSNSYYPRYL